ncbi:MAG TPA: hypothetical protein VFH27_02710 [Longimicrobiaceae bacterium]|nr:hypothetical protein [Longimicrobiaceae bacterium]
MKRLSISAASLAASLLVLGGCVSTHAEWIGTPPSAQPQRIPQEMVRVYMAEADLPQGYEKVAVIWVEGDTRSTSNRRLVDAARRKAGFLGANAVVLGRFHEPSTGARILAGVLDVPLERRTEVLAVRLPSADDPHPAVSVR